MKTPVRKNNPNHSFQKAAKEYDAYAYLQQVVARELISRIDDSALRSVLDLGCGTGAIFRVLDPKPAEFIAVDLSSEMLAQHPKNPSVTPIQSDFNAPTLYNRTYDLIIASSSLQWSYDLDESFSLIAKSAKEVAFAIFTSGSLQEIHRYVGSTSPIPTKETIETLLKRHFTGVIDIKHYPLSFPTRKAMLAYLKGSGIGGDTRLDYKKSKKLITSAPFERLSFEVLFFVGKPTQGI